MSKFRPHTYLQTRALPLLAFVLVAPLYSCSATPDAAAGGTDAATKGAPNANTAGNAVATGKPGTPGTSANGTGTANANGTVGTPAVNEGAAASGSIGGGKYKWEKPASVKGIYMTAWTAGGTKKLEKLMSLLDKTELNSVVIDVRDSGEMYWKMGIPLADQSGATQVAVTNPEKLFRRLEKHKVWPIARVAIFRDNFVPKKFPDRAVRFADGRVWRDRAGNSWLDPYNKENWEYIAQTIDFAMDIGFPEIQLDYVRFPSEGKMSTMSFPARKKYPNPKATPAQVIADFCDYVGKRVHARGGVYTADIFGIISSSTTKDQGIGQSLELIVKPFDVVCPMVYPSHYAKGEYGIADPNASPYAIITKSLGDYKRRVPEAKVRPWLQDFFGYGAKEVQAQIKAARDLGYDEYLMWNAQNNFTSGAYAREGASSAKGSAGKAAPAAPATNATQSDKKA